jgi:hypothetical protein
MPRRHQNLSSLATVTAFATCAFAVESLAGTLEIHSIRTTPDVVLVDQPFDLTLTGFNLLGGLPGTYQQGQLQADPEQYEVTVNENTIEIRYRDVNGGICISPAPPIGSNVPHRRQIAIPGLPAGDYSVHIDYGIERFCGTAWTSAQTTIKIYVDGASERRVYHETPAIGATVSGIGLIRGWACYYGPGLGAAPTIGTITYRIDDGPDRILTYGALREDTEEACSLGPSVPSVHTGYGAVVYWGAYGPGEHTFTLLIDGEVVDERQFFVAAPAAGFMKGLSASYDLEDFPVPGQSVRVEWSEADQNFIIVDFLD